MEGKVCTKCGVWKPLEEYYKRKTSKDGRESRCKGCRNEDEKQRWSKKHPKKIKEVREGMKKCAQYREVNKEKRKENTCYSSLYMLICKYRLSGGIICKVFLN